MAVLHPRSKNSPLHELEPDNAKRQAAVVAGTISITGSITLPCMILLSTTEIPLIASFDLLVSILSFVLVVAVVAVVLRIVRIMIVVVVLRW